MLTLSRDIDRIISSEEGARAQAATLVAIRGGIVVGFGSTTPQIDL